MPASKRPLDPAVPTELWEVRQRLLSRPILSSSIRAGAFEGALAVFLDRNPSDGFALSLLDDIDEATFRQRLDIETSAAPAEPKLASGPIEIFTDGGTSPNPGPGGWGFTVRVNEAEIHHACGGASATTNNIMEMTAVIEALLWLDGRPADIWSDSQYVINGLNEWRQGWKRRGWKKADGSEVLNAKLWARLDEIAIRSKARFKWCRGHNGNVGNERADQLVALGRRQARQAA